MIGATLYIVMCTARNRLNRRLRRLREPRYLIGALVGVAYLYGTILLRTQAYRVRSDPGAAVRGGSLIPSFGVAGPALGGLLVALAAAFCWLVPIRSTLLDFSLPEVSLLFPAPVTRRGLVLYRLMRSQVAVLGGALIIAFAYPTGSMVNRLRGLVAVWLLLMTCRVFFTGVTLARSRMRRPESHSVGAWLALAVSVGSVSSVLVGLLAQTRRAPMNTAKVVVESAASMAQHGVPWLLLWPFSAVARPLFQSTRGDYGASVVAAVASYVVCVGWLLWMDHGSDIGVDRATEMKQERPHGQRRTYVARQVAWNLSERGRPEMALVWKAALQTFRIVDRRVLFRVGLILAWMVAASVFVTRVRGFTQVIGLFAAWGAGFATVMAPQVIRVDMRQDLAHLELLKTWPVSGAALVRGELTWPATLVTGIAWTFGVIALLLSGIAFPRLDLVFRVAVGLSLLILVPGVVFAQYAIHNGVALVFPGWVPLGTTRPRGVDAMGQRLILLGGTWVALAAALVPGGGATLLLWVLFHHAVGDLILIPGALVTAALLALEFVTTTALLGPVYERLDITSVERPE